MPREHASIKMGHDELVAFLSSDRRVVVASQDRMGEPWIDALACHFARTRMYFVVPDKTRTASNIASDPRVCCVIESKPTISSYYDIKGAMLHGEALPLDDADPAAGVVRAWLSEVEDPVTREHPARGRIFSVGLEDSTSFAFDKITYRYEDRSLS